MKVEIKGNCLSGDYSRLEVSTSDRFRLLLHEDSQSPTSIPLDIDNIIVDKHLVSIGQEHRVNVVEHLFSALYGMNLFNVRIDVFSDEIPFFDGSSQDFVELLQDIFPLSLRSASGGEAILLFNANIKDCPVPKTESVDSRGVNKTRNDEKPYFFRNRCNLLRFNKKLLVEQSESFILYEPLKKDKLLVEMELTHPFIETQRITLEVNKETYIKEIAPARTFAFVNEDDPRLKNLPAYGIGITKNNIYSKEPLRFQNELVRHKILDLLGDLYVLKKKLVGKIICKNTSHQLNLRFVRKLVLDFIK